MQTSCDSYGRDDLRLAITTILITVFLLSLGDALIKLEAHRFPLWQVLVLRSLIAIPLAIVLRHVVCRGIALSPKGLFWSYCRSILLVGMWICFYCALFNMSFSIAAAAYYTSPIFIALLSPIFSNSRISAKTVIYASIGFAGVVLILRPDVNDVDLFVALPFIAALLYALAMILTHSKCQQEHPIVLSITLNVTFIFAGGLMGIVSGLIECGVADDVFGHWSSLSIRDWAYFIYLAVAVLLASIGTAIAYQRGSPPIIGMFDFAYVGFAVLWSALMFQEQLSVTELGGVLLISVAGCLSIRRHRKVIS